MDWHAYKLTQNGEKELIPDIKRQLALLLLEDFTFQGNATPISVAMMRTAQTLAYKGHIRFTCDMMAVAAHQNILFFNFPLC